MPARSEESYTNKYQRHIGCSYGYKLICVDKFNKPYFGEDSVYKFVNSMIEERKYCKELIKKHFNKGLVITKKKMKIFRNLLTVGSVTMIMLIMTLK